MPTRMSRIVLVMLPALLLAAGLALLCAAGLVFAAAPPQDGSASGLVKKETTLIHTADGQERTVQALTARVEALERQAAVDIHKEQAAAHRAMVALNVVFSLAIVIGASLLFFGSRGMRDIRRMARRIRTAREQADEDVRNLPAVDITCDIAPELAATLTDLGRRLDLLEEFGQPLEAADCVARGNAWYAQGDYSRAASWYNRAVAEAPNLADAHYRRGIALQRLGKLEEALASFDHVVELDPTDPEAPYVRGLVLQQLGRPHEAADAFSRAIALAPEWVRAYLARAAARVQLGRNDEALADVARAVQLDPSSRDEVEASAAFQGLRGDPGYRRLIAPAKVAPAA